MILKNKSITLTLIIYILSIVLFVFTLSYSYNYFISYKIIKNSLAREANALAHSTVNETSIIFTRVQSVGETIASYIKDGNNSDEKLLSMLKSSIGNNPEIYSATIAFEPYAFDSSKKYFAPSVSRDDDKIKTQYLGGESYQYHLMDWYQIPTISGQPTWSEPYYDTQNTEDIMVTFSTPILDNDQKIYGILRLDISLSWLHKMISNININHNGYAFLISKNGTFITYPDESIILNETIFGLATVRKDENLRNIGRSMIKGEYGFTRFVSIITGESEWMAYAPIKINDWSLAVIFSNDAIHYDIKILTYQMIAIALCGLILISSAIVLVSRRITKPLINLAEATKEISTGSFNFKLKYNDSKDEISVLSNSFISMQSSLEEYISQLKITTAAKERIEGELKVAHDIQMSIIPRIFPAFPQREELDLYAIMEPAKEVGGDLYDFFFIDPDHICIIIGDVSGKGVPASLFMAVTNTMIKVVAAEVKEPEKIMAKVNKQLSQGNETCMFVTLFCGILNIKTGEFCYSNGGHNPPILISNKECDYITVESAIALGIDEDATFTQEKLFLKKGDALFLYTDGVTEAFNEKEEQFSEEQLLRKIKEYGSSHPITVCSNILCDIKSFAGNEPQSDDITILMLEYKN